MAESLSTSETYNVVPDSHLTAVSQTVTGVTGDIVCGHMCMTAETYICVAYSYCLINRTCLLSEHLPASANGWQGLSDSNCDIYKISAGLFKTNFCPKMFFSCSCLLYIGVIYSCVRGA